MRITGQCHCANITYEADVDPTQLQVCHCEDCQRLSGSPFRASIPTKNLTFTRGQPKVYIKLTAASGRKRAQAFCPDCGSPFYAGPAEPTPDAVYNLRFGTINERAQLTPYRAIWCETAVPWAEDISGLPKVRGQ